jgi:hypothetical protein
VEPAVFVPETLSGMELMTVFTGFNQSYAIRLFPIAFTGTIFSFILVWLLLAHNIFNGGRWIKALSVFLFVLGLIFIGSFFDASKAIDALEITRLYGSWICALFLALQAIQSRRLLVNISQKLTLVFLMIFISIEWYGRENEYAIEKIGSKFPRYVNWLIYYIIILIVFYFTGSEQQFIYFQF